MYYKILKDKITSRKATVAIIGLGYVGLPLLIQFYRKGFNYLKQLNLKPNVEKLQKDGYVKLSEHPENHTIRQEFIDLFSCDFDQMFADL